jgi:hypothetical protein
MSTTNAPTQGNPSAIAQVPQPGAGAMVRQEFGATELAVSGDLGAAVRAAEAQALVQARYVMALRQPRDWDLVAQRIEREVERPGFAEVAYYRKPVGDGVEGLSVHFADAAARCMGNLMEEAPVIYEDDRKRVIRVIVTDLESNHTKVKEVTVVKTVERSSLNDGRIAISTRMNSRGKPTYTVPATEDELIGKEAALISKTRRNLLLQILPGDIKDRSKARIIAIRNGAVAKDPDGARKKILDAFAAMNILATELKKYLGHDLATATPAEIQDLRDLYSAIHAGETTWPEALAEKTTPPDSDAGEAQATTQKPGLAGVTERMQQQAATATKVEPPLAATTPPPAAPVPDRVPGEDDGPDPAAAPADTDFGKPPSATTTAKPRGAGQKKLEE